MKADFPGSSLLVFLLLCSEAFACSISIPPLRKDFRGADAVFVGRVQSVSMVPNPDLSLIPKSWDNWKGFDRITFQVERQWKGDRVKTRDYVGVSAFDCGCPGDIDQFEVGRDYLVFARTERFVTICESEEIGRGYVGEKMKRLDSFWFRSWSRINPF